MSRYVIVAGALTGALLLASIWVFVQLIDAPHTGYCYEPTGRIGQGIVVCETDR